MRSVVTLAAPGTPLFELGIPARLFGAARAADGPPLYSVTVVAADGSRALRTSEGLSIQLEAGLEALDAADIVIVASSEQLLDEQVAYRLTDRLRPLLTRDGDARQGLRVASICSGAFLLAALHLLDGKSATTHWRHAALLTSRFPAIEVDPDALYVDQGSVFTSAGVAAGIDLCLHIIRRDHGVRVANDVARACIVAPFREGGQTQYIQTPIPVPGPATSAVTTWMLQHLDEPHTTASMASHAHMSTRTFERRFKEENGMAPGRWLTQARVQRAKEYLETTDHPIDRIAHAVGLGTAANLRTHFHRCAGQTPNAYRRLFAP